MSKWTVSLMMLFTSASAFAGDWAGEWEDTAKINAIKNGSIQVLDVKIQVYNMAETPEGRKACGEAQCYRMDVFINDKQIATWATSPGYRRKWAPAGESKGSYSPIYNGENILTHYNMRYAMYIEKKSEPGVISDIAFHGKYLVTGRQESHGCFRMRDREAALLNSWIRKVFVNDGEARLWSRGTRVRYYDNAQPVG